MWRKVEAEWCGQMNGGRKEDVTRCVEEVWFGDNWRKVLKAEDKELGAVKRR